MKKRLFSLALLCLMLLGTLTACNVTITTSTTTAATTTTGGSSSQTPLTSTFAHALKKAGYTFVFPQYYSSTLNEAAKKISTAYETLTGDMMDMKDDFVKKGKPIPEHNMEILFGSTNRASSVALVATLKANRPNSGKDWQIVMKDKEILISAGSDLGLVEAADAFVRMLSAPASNYSFDGYDSGLKLHTWELETLGGKPTSAYKIVIPENASAALQTQASAVRSTIFDLSGYTLEIVTDTTAKSDCEIVLGHTSRPVSATLVQELNELRNNNYQDYILSGSGTTLGIMAGHDEGGTASAVADLKNVLNASQKDTMNISKTYQKDGLVDLTVDGTPLGNFNIVIAQDATFDIKYNAMKFCEFLESKTGYILSIVTDETDATEHELLLGMTNRSASTATDLTEYQMVVKNGHLVIDAGHYYGVTMALADFLGAYRNTTEAITLSATYSITGETDIPLTWHDDGSAAKLPQTDLAQKQGEYTLVWNDEFADLWSIGWINEYKWCQRTSMSMHDVYNMWNKEVVNVEDDTLILTTDLMAPDSRKNPVNGKRYKTNNAVSTRSTMNYVYGYLEMKAQIPFIGKGEWPSFWTTSSGDFVDLPEDRTYGVEIDFFEQFSSTDTVVPNLHKWGTSGRGHYQLSGIDQGGTLANSKTRGYVFSSKAEANKMHTYGFLWTEHLMAFSVDDEFYYSRGISDSHDFGEPDTAGMEGFREHPLDILLNNMIFSEGYGEESPWGAGYAKKLEDSIFPYYYVVDYMRFYQIEGYGQLYTTQIDF